MQGVTLDVALPDSKPGPSAAQLILGDELFEVASINSFILPQSLAPRSTSDVMVILHPKSSIDHASALWQ